VEKGKLLYEGKAKKVYEVLKSELIIQEFKDAATAFDGKKKGIITGKGDVNAQVSARLFQLLEEKGIRTHFKKLLTKNELLTERLEMIPVEVIVRNIAAGSLAKRLGYKEGQLLKKTIIELYYKSDELGDPILNEDHIAELGLATPDELRRMKKISLKVNQVLKEFFDQLGVTLVDFKLEFGRKDGEIVLADEISPDTCRLWDKRSGERLDKDRFRHDLGRVEETYQEVLKRVKEAGL
jgi:phosphoribosylaminoimidazole-succinocarboxamide synthase